MSNPKTAKPAPGSSGKRVSNEDCSGKQISRNDIKQSTDSQQDPAVKDAFLGELRCASMRAKLAQYDMDAAAIAVSGNLITVEQAMALLADRDALHWLFQGGTP